MIREEIADGVHRIEEAYDGGVLTTVLVAAPEHVLLVDAGLRETPRRTVLPAMREIGISPDALRMVVITHADVDHSGGLSELRRISPSALIACHRSDAALVEDVETMLDRRYREFRHDHAIDEDEEFITWVRRNGEGALVDLSLFDGERIRVAADRWLEVVCLPGHSLGQIGLFDRHTATAMVGDAVLGTGTPDRDGHPMFAPTYRHVAAYRCTIDAVRALGAQRLISGHLPVLEGEQITGLLDESSAFCDRLEDAILSELARASGPRTVRELIVAVAPVIRGWPPEADSSLCYAVVGHLEDLAARGLVAAIAGRVTSYERVREAVVAGH